MFTFKLLLLSVFVSTTLAAPSLVEKDLPLGTVTCGRNAYSVDQIRDAVDTGVSDLNSGNFPNNHPHQFFDHEGIPLFCESSGPWYEFPILPNGNVYTSGSPGADRVIFTSEGMYCAVVTHTGAPSRNGFVACSND